MTPHADHLRHEVQSCVKLCCCERRRQATCCLLAFVDRLPSGSYDSQMQAFVSSLNNKFTSVGKRPYLWRKVTYITSITNLWFIFVWGSTMSENLYKGANLAFRGQRRCWD